MQILTNPKITKNFFLWSLSISFHPPAKAHSPSQHIREHPLSRPVTTAASGCCRVWPCHASRRSETARPRHGSHTAVTGGKAGKGFGMGLDGFGVTQDQEPQWEVLLGKLKKTSLWSRSWASARADYDIYPQMAETWPIHLQPNTGVRARNMSHVPHVRETD